MQGHHTFIYCLREDFKYAHLNFQLFSKIYVEC